MKVAPDVTDEHIAELSRVFLDEGLDGLIATNTTLSRVGVEANPRHEEAGGLSGAPLTERSTEVIGAFASELKGRIPIIGVGGIMNVYRGPDLIRECVEAMKAECPVHR